MMDKFNGFFVAMLIIGGMSVSAFLLFCMAYGLASFIKAVI